MKEEGICILLLLHTIKRSSTFAMDVGVFAEDEVLPLCVIIAQVSSLNCYRNNFYQFIKLQY